MTEVAGPTYLIRGYQEFDSNPLIAHLRLPPETDSAAFLALGQRPDFNVQDRDLPNSIRRLRIKRLRRFYVPTLEAHRQALIEIATNVLDGYIARNPMTARGQALLHGGAADLEFRPAISLIAGHSGMGKSTLIDRILAYLGEQLNQHVQFDGKPFPEKQILYLRRNCPEHCTVGTLCSTFGDYTDRVLGLELYAGVFAKLKGGSRTLYLAEISKIIKAHHVGFLVIDEFQNLSLMGVGAKKIIALLVNLRDELGLPIVVVGTYKALRLLEGDMSTGRRLVEGGYFDLQRPASAQDKSWIELCEIAWKYQWVRKPIKFDPDICEALYDVSQGITGIMLSAFSLAQLAAINNGTECVDAELIRKVYIDRMKPLHAALRVLQSGDPRLMDTFDDLYKNHWPTQDEGIDGSDSRAPADVPEDSKSDEREEPAQPVDEPKPVRAKRKAADAAAAPVQAKLSPEQVKKMVMADSVGDLISLLDKQ
ncbi:MAG: AAA family ATPase [Proteobacteria bacterium]|nr:AAA family ATPase [Pseudomonadota bacterium]